MINVGSAFQIGSSHRVCEDFALHGEADTPKGKLSYGIVCDGCSTSLMDKGARLPINVDTGARLLALAAQEAILKEVEQLDECVYWRLQQQILPRAEMFIRTLGLPIEALDCTLLVNIVRGTEGIVLMWGDGEYVIRTDDFCIHRSVVYPSGAPYYLSYDMEHSRRKRYEQEFGVRRYAQQVITNECGDLVNTPSDRESFDGTYGLSFQHYMVGDGEHGEIVIISDGARSFQKSVGNKKEPVDLSEIIPQLINVGGVKGDFMGRLMNKLNRYCRQHKIDHYDDLVISMIVNRPDEEQPDDHN